MGEKTTNDETIDTKSSEDNKLWGNGYKSRL